MEADVEIPCTTDGPWGSHSLFWASVTPLQQGKKLSAQEGRQMPEGNTKQSPALCGLQMATGPPWSEESLSQEWLAEHSSPRTASFSAILL